MLKIFGTVGLIALMSTAYAFEKFEFEAYAVETFDCNYNILRSNKEAEVGKILQQIPITVEDIKKDLDFLHLPTQHMPKVTFNAEGFEDLFSKSKKLDFHNKDLNQDVQKFVNNCSEIFHVKGQKPITQQAVYMLLEEVTRHLEEHIREVNKMKDILNLPKNKNLP